jgi:hypothetical protein
MLVAAHLGSGYDLQSLAEYLLPADLAVLIFTSPRKLSQQGRLHVLFRQQMETWLYRALFSTITCTFDPACSEHGGCCYNCLRLPRGCETFDHGISRAYLHGGTVTFTDQQTFFIRRGFWA